MLARCDNGDLSVRCLSGNDACHTRANDRLATYLIINKESEASDVLVPDGVGTPKGMQAPVPRTSAFLFLGSSPEKNIAELRAHVQALHRARGRDTFGIADSGTARAQRKKTAPGAIYISGTRIVLWKRMMKPFDDILSERVTA